MIKNCCRDLIVFCILGITLLFGPCLYAQEKPATTTAATGNHPKTTLADALKRMQKLLHIDVLFEHKSVQNLVVAENSIREDQSAEENLATLLKPFSLTYRKVKTNTYLIIPARRNQIPADSLKAKPALINEKRVSSTGVATETGPVRPGMRKPAADTVTGTVVNEFGAPVSGVTVKEKEGAHTGVSDKSGSFSIAVSKKPATLIFSYVGYHPKEVEVTAGQILKVGLTPNSAELENVVVVGYGTQKRKDLTGAVSSIDAKQLKDIPVNSAAQALTGRLAGVQVSTTEGAPGAPVTIRVRGGGSITQDNSPLFIVDGIQVEDALSRISPQDIESVDVLKDASATAIYGARGANGVIIITTKGGKPAKTTVDYSGFFGVNKLAKKLDVMNPAQFINYYYERIRNSTNDSIQFVNMYGHTWDTLKIFDNVPAVNWQNEVFGRSAFLQTHNVSVSGGTQQTTFALSLTKNVEDGVMINSSFDRNLVSFKINNKASDKLRLGFNFRYNSQTIRGSGTSASGTINNGKLRQSIQYRPFLWKVNSIDEFDQAYYDQSTTGLYFINPKLLSNAEYRDRGSSNININGFGDYVFNKWLSFRFTAGIDRYNEVYNSFDDYITWAAISNSNGLPIVSVSNQRRTSVNLSNVFTFSNDKLSASFHKKNSIRAVLGQELYQVKTEQVNNQVRYFPKGISPEKALAQLSLGTSSPLYPNANFAKSTLASFFTRVNYAYNDRYLASFTLRADGSSKFAERNHWGAFSSGSLAWRVSRENFMKNISEISDLKLRLSYGLAGNNRINDFLYRPLYYSNNSPYGLRDEMVPGYMISSLANPDLKWETTVSRNLGVDLSMFNNAVTVSVDAYSNDTRDLLINVPIASNSGYSTQLRNVGSTRNKGIELQIAAAVMKKKAFSWDLNFNISSNKNSILKLYNNQENYFVNTGWGTGSGLPDFVVQVGQPVGAMYGFVTDGFYTLDDFDYEPTTRIYSLKKGVADNTSAVGTPQPGSLKLKDLSGDGVVDAVKDRTIIGNATPKFYGGFNSQLSYKHFDCSVFLNFVVGNDIMNANKIAFTNSYQANSNLLATMNDRWRTIDDKGTLLVKYATINNKQVVVGESPEVLAAANKNAKIWQPLRGASALVLHSWAVENGSFLRVNNITVGYTMPEKMTSLLRIRSIRFYATVNNLAVLTSYTGYDPEVSTRNYNYVTPGVDDAAYPRSKTYLLGINVKF